MTTANLEYQFLHRPAGGYYLPLKIRLALWSLREERLNEDWTFSFYFAALGKEVYDQPARPGTPLTWGNILGDTCTCRPKDQAACKLKVDQQFGFDRTIYLLEAATGERLIAECRRLIAEHAATRRQWLADNPEVPERAVVVERYTDGRRDSETALTTPRGRRTRGQRNIGFDEEIEATAVHSLELKSSTAA